MDIFVRSKLNVSYRSKLVVKHEGKLALGTRKRKWKHDIKIRNTEIDWHIVDRIYLSRDTIGSVLL